MIIYGWMHDGCRQRRESSEESSLFGRPPQLPPVRRVHRDHAIRCRDLNQRNPVVKPELGTFLIARHPGDRNSAGRGNKVFERSRFLHAHTMPEEYDKGALCAQLRYRPPDGSSADVVLLLEASFAGEDLAGLEAPGLDVTAQDVGELRVERHASGLRSDHPLTLG